MAIGKKEGGGRVDVITKSALL